MIAPERDGRPLVSSGHDRRRHRVSGKRRAEFRNARALRADLFDGMRGIAARRPGGIRIAQVRQRVRIPDLLDEREHACQQTRESHVQLAVASQVATTPAHGSTVSPVNSR